MTTIVANRKEICADSCSSWDSEFFISSDKIEIIGKSVVAVAGHVPSIMKFLRWFKDPTSEHPEFPDDDEKGFSAIVLDEKGLWIYNDTCYPQRVDDQFIATGTGMQAAKAAMICGKSPRQAVEVAIQCDKNSKGPVQRVTLQQALRNPRKS